MTGPRGRTLRGRRRDNGRSAHGQRGRAPADCTCLEAMPPGRRRQLFGGGRGTGGACDLEAVRDSLRDFVPEPQITCAFEQG